MLRYIYNNATQFKYQDADQRIVVIAAVCILADANLRNALQECTTVCFVFLHFSCVP